MTPIETAALLVFVGVMALFAGELFGYSRGWDARGREIPKRAETPAPVPPSPPVWVGWAGARSPVPDYVFEYLGKRWRGFSTIWRNVETAEMAPEEIVWALIRARTLQEWKAEEARERELQRTGGQP